MEQQLSLFNALLSFGVHPINFSLYLKDLLVIILFPAA